MNYYVDVERGVVALMKTELFDALLAVCMKESIGRFINYCGFKKLLEVKNLWEQKVRSIVSLLVR